MKNLTIEIIDKCALYCNHCSTYGSWDRDDIIMSPKDIVRIVAENSSFNEVRLSGGEPFMHPDIVEIVKNVRSIANIKILSSGVFRYINDNSPIPDELLVPIKKDVHTINLSLHALNDMHDKITGVKGAFACLDETIGRIIENEIPFSFNYVALGMNYQFFEDVVGYVSEKRNEMDYCNPKLYVLNYIEQGNIKYDDPLNLSSSLILNDETRTNLLNDIEFLKQRYNIDIVPSCSMEKRDCTADSGKKVYTVYGDIVNCSALKWKKEKRCYKSSSNLKII